MAYTTVNDPSIYFNTVLYTGNGKDDRAVIGTGFQPDWLWYKERSSTSEHRSFDSSRGASKRIEPNNDNQEATDTTNHKSFDSDGFTVGTSGSTNAVGDTYVAWQWKCNGGTTSSDSNGSITSTVQVNTDAGFSIVLYAGAGVTRTVGHGLGTAPKWIVIKNRNKSAGEGWVVYHGANTSAPETDGLHLNLTNATNDTTDYFSDQAVTSTTFGVSGDDRSGGSFNYVAYCFAEKQGYSKFGSYVGNGAQDGTFVYTGFKPAWLMIKRTDAAKNWYIADSKRSPSNITKAFLVANSSDAEDTSGDTTDAYFDILSNGFKLRQDFSHLNADGGTHIYMAFAESPFVTSNKVPNNAR